MAIPMLSQLLDALGPSPMRLLTAPASAEVQVSGVLVYEPRAALPAVPHGVLFAVGIRPATAEALELARQAALAGHAALVVKCYGEPVTELAAVAGHAGLALLAADDDLAWQLLDALVSSALAAISRSARRDATPAVGDLFALANAIAAQTGGAASIEDPLRRILAYSTLPGQPIDEHRRQGILGLRVPDVPVNDAQYRELARTDRVCRFTAGPGSMPRLAISVRAGHDLLGSIWVVDETGTLGADADQALTEAARIAALHMLAARTAADVVRRQRGDLLRRLLADPASAALVAPQLGLATDLPVAVAAFVIASAEPDDVLAAHTAARFTDLVSLNCEAHYGQSGCALIDGAVYALLPVHPAGRAHYELVWSIARRAQQALRVPIRAGLGGQVAGPGAAAMSRQDADLVMRVLASQRGPAPSRGAALDGGAVPGGGAALASGGPVVASIDEVRASATLAELSQALSGLPRLREGSGQRLRAHDAAHGTAYASTLLAYLEANSDVAAAAQRLSIHPNTCRYRLARAETVAAFSLADPDQRLLLWLELRLAA